MNELIKQLSREEYLATMSGKMHNVTETAEPLVNIWSFVKRLPKSVPLSEYGVQKGLIEAVYENEQNTYQHILLFGEKKNSYVVLIIDVEERSILGYYPLDIDKEYRTDK